MVYFIFYFIKYMNCIYGVLFYEFCKYNNIIELYVCSWIKWKNVNKLVKEKIFFKWFIIEYVSKILIIIG